MHLLTELAAFIPRDRVAWLWQKTPLTQTGVAMIADISGFTPLTEALTHGLRSGEGAEALTEALGQVFTPLIETIHQYQGSVLKFGGDALIVWFGEQSTSQTVLSRAITCALMMQQQVKVVGRVQTPIGSVTLKMKIGLAYGVVKRLVLGTEATGFEDVVVGGTLDRMAEAEHQAEPSEVIVDGDTLPLLPSEVQWVARAGVGVVQAIAPKAKQAAWPPLSHSAPDAILPKLLPYVPAQIGQILLAGVPSTAELRPVVSLFVQFHGLDYDGDAWVVEKLEQYFKLAQMVVERFNGRLNRLLTGDKGSLIHVIFGAPLSVEEQEARAVQCALDLQAECGGLPFITMQRIGVSVGRVFAGPVGSPVRHDYTTMGDAINLSARLMQHAADDQILLSEAVRLALPDHFKLTDLGTIQVKGKSELIRVFSADGIGQRQQKRATIADVYGREAELETIRQKVSLLQTGEGGLITLVGDVGMGKTLLLNGLREESTNQRLNWATGISLAYGQSLSGYLFIDILRDLLRLPSSATPEQTSSALFAFCQHWFADVFASYPYLAQFMGLPLTADMQKQIMGASGESVRWRIFELLPQLLARMSGERPLIIAVDDLQWADPTSLQLVESLIAVSQSQPLLLILAMRPEETILQWARAQQILAEQMATHRWQVLVRLKPLTETAVVALLTHHAPHLPQRMIDYLAGKGGGNPLYLVELARTMQQVELPDQLDSLPLEQLQLPNSVQGLLLAQLERLSAESRHTLQMASIIGRTFLHKVLAHLADSEQHLTRLLPQLEQKAFIEADEAELGTAHTFRHILIQQSAYNSLLQSRRKQYHVQVAHTFEQLFPTQIGEQAAFLAHHYEQGEQWDKAIAFWNQTADQARLLYAHEEAKMLYEKVLALLSVDDDERRARTYLKLAQLYANQMDYVTSQQYSQQAFALWANIHPPTEEVDALPQRVFRWGVDPEHLTQFDPKFTNWGENQVLVKNLFAGLMELDDEWTVLPALAKQWQVSEDGLTYQFTLHDELYWSDGVLLTAQDFVFGIQRNLDPQQPSELASQLYVIAGAEAYQMGKNGDFSFVGIEAIDNQTIQFQLAEPFPYFPYLLTDPITFPQPTHAIVARSDDWAIPLQLVNNGPYRFESNTMLSVNPRYRGARTGNVAQIELVAQSPTLSAYVDEKVDWVRIDDSSKMIGFDNNLSSYSIQDLATFALFFSCHHAPFNNRAVRQAFALALDRQRLVQDVWGTLQLPAQGGLIPAGMIGHSPYFELPFNPYLAQQQLQGVLLPENITMVVFPGFGDVPMFLLDSWQRYLGVKVKVIADAPVEESLGWLKTGEAHLLLLGANLDYPDPDDMLRTFAYSTSGFNFTGWQNSRFDRLLDEAKIEPSMNKRLALYRQADKLLVERETAVFPLYYLHSYGLLRQGFRFANPNQVLLSYRFQFKNLITE